ncbi:tautomerase family protein [Rhizobiaceae bacterium n13]|uniref:Tautomerase family protein n=1 Tax=Ferirhizobium litorale TaxID=2927786 RepID=A0AAE3QF97_9HYPH|nr:tautomerase family protein [Fererhizobium litorale]MDI7864512.1 tautomerase family protein [Fererhizobium litorale]MDI7924737.1 tautomerase family protein [Fererhizobium litorale]
MPFVSVKLLAGAFDNDQKHSLAKALTDLMVNFKGSEDFREVTWVRIEELHTECGDGGDEPTCGPLSVKNVLQPSKSIYELIEGNWTSRHEFAVLEPAKAASATGSPTEYR